MPQTVEHLEVLQILQTKKGVVAITKADLVDEEWLELVREEIADALQGTFLAGAPMIALSSVTGQGLPELTATLDRIADEVESRPAVGPWRLPVDRVFTMGGFGTVVTGTLISGTVRVGDRAEVLPQGLETRVRGLQVHGSSAETAEAGTRVAMNLAGVDADAVARGDLCASAGVFTPTLALDARLNVLPSFPREVKNRSRVRLYVGTAEIMARLTLLDAEVLCPGDTGLVQLRLEEPTACAKGERYVLRSYSPMQLIGGGAILEPHPLKHRRFDAAALGSLAVKEQGTPEELILQAVARSGLTPIAPAQIAQQLGHPVEETRARMAALRETGQLVGPDIEGKPAGEAMLNAEVVAAAEGQVLDALRQFHRAQPLRAGMSREELRSRLSRSMDAKGFNLVLSRLEKQGRVVSQAGRVRDAEHQPTFTPEQKEAANRIEAELLRERFSPPSPEEVMSRAGSAPAARAVWEALLDHGAIVRVADGVFFHRTALEDVARMVRDHLATQGTMTAAAFRDLIGSSRKYAVPLLEYLDATRVTRRVGDERVLF
jgi:selenocysteine-specific elongation factor